MTSTTLALGLVFLNLRSCFSSLLHSLRLSLFRFCHSLGFLLVAHLLFRLRSTNTALLPLRRHITQFVTVQPVVRGPRVGGARIGGNVKEAACAFAVVVVDRI